MVVVLPTESKDEIHINESNTSVLFCGSVNYSVQGGSNFCQNVDKSLECSYLNESFWQWAPVVLFIMLNVVVNDFSSAIYKIFEISY